ncbi:MAG: Gfo/Idh/MocA family oxidoreductase [Pseudomonadota bacterium]
MRLGIIGTGLMASAINEASKDLTDIEVVAVLSRKLQTARNFCAHTAQTAMPFDDMSCFLNSIDAVYIATPPSQHAIAIEAALKAGRAVLCEKPLTTTSEDTERVVALARLSGVTLMEAIWTLVLPTYRAAADSLLHLGLPRRLTFDFSYPLEVAESSHFLERENGGVLLDRAVYGLSAGLSFLGTAIDHKAFITRDATGLDRSAELRLIHAGGDISIISISFDLLGGNGLEIAGPNGLIRIGPPSLAAETMHWEPYSSSAPTNFGKGSKNTKYINRLKAQPTVRRLRSTVKALRQRFHDYGASPYAPMLTEFRQVAESGNVESSLVPLQLSCEIAAIVQKARQCGVRQ